MNPNDIKPLPIKEDPIVVLPTSEDIKKLDRLMQALLDAGLPCVSTYPDFHADFVPELDETQQRVYEDIRNNFDPSVPTWDEIRQERDALLRSTDWTQLPDASLTDVQKTAVTAYRQSLRDIPQVYQTAEAVIMPTNPLEVIEEAIETIP